MTKENVYRELIEKIRSGKIKNQSQLEKQKTKIAKKHNIDKVVKNAELIQFLKKDDRDCKKLYRFLKIKPVRTASGVANIAVMWQDKNNISMSCPGNCIYCPQGQFTDAKGVLQSVPKSYTGSEPATMRAVRASYDPYEQTKNRLWQLDIIGHPTDKCELIIMGGTFLAAKESFQENFVKRCLDAFNEKQSKTVEQAIKKNEKAKHRCVGLTIETRADYCKSRHIKQMLKLGCTRVEIGVQTTDDEILEKINRGHTVKENIQAIKLAKQAGLKVCVHWMPGLTGLNKLDIKKEIEMFKELFENPDYQPDELKIYPTLVIPETKLHEIWKNKKFQALTTENAIDLLIELKKYIPKYIRVKRVMRDISHKEVVAGPNITNLRQKTHEKMYEKTKNNICNCIRCREVGLQKKKPEHIKLNKMEYEASEGKEIFLSFEDNKNNLLLAFLRLRIDDSDTAKIRELHVYGPMVEIGKKSKHTQHKGYGKKLLKESEKPAKRYGKSKIQVTSGVGVRSYYSKLGYKLAGHYMVKNV